MAKRNCSSNCIRNITKYIKLSIYIKIVISLSFFLISTSQLNAQLPDSIKTENVTFESEGVIIAGTIYKPNHSYAAVVIVHGSGQEARMTGFAKLLAKNGISSLTYDKRGVGESGGIYAGPEVGTNNIDSVNLALLAKDVSAAVNILNKQNKNIPIGLLGYSQAGWIIPMAANNNPLVKFMVLFSCPTVTTLEQLKFQFYTDGRTDFWENHTENEAREHIKNAPDRYQFTSTDPKISLSNLSIPGLWLFGQKDIQIPVNLCIEHLNNLKVTGKPFEYTVFSTLGHNTAFANTTAPVDISIHWIKQQTLNIKKCKTKK